MKRLIFLLWLFATPLYAVEPDEVLADPGLEARARSLGSLCRHRSRNVLKLSVKSGS